MPWALVLLVRLGQAPQAQLPPGQQEFGVPPLEVRPGQEEVWILLVEGELEGQEKAWILMLEGVREGQALPPAQ